MQHLTIDGDRLWATLMRSAEIGPGKAGGLKRLAASDEDKKMRDQFADWCSDAGLIITVDRLGNMFARREGTEDNLPPVTMGSHLDTQYAGGRFDGILGVLTGLEIVRTLNDREIVTKRPIEVVNWTNEEGCRFSPSMCCSGAFAGVYDADWVANREDDEGFKQGEELERIGYRGPSEVGGRNLDSYFELHIEQGPMLHAAGEFLGVVTKGAKTHGMHVDVQGVTSHAGPTPMMERHDALAGAARVIAAVNDIGLQYHNSGGRATASRVIAWPNKPGILAEWAQFSVDCRHPDPAIANAMRADIEESIRQAADKNMVTMEIVSRWEFGDETFSIDLIDLIRKHADAQGVKCRDMMSLAGHDAYYVSKVAPAVLIFSPCADGITHNESESIDLESTLPAVNVLLNSVVARANR